MNSLQMTCEESVYILELMILRDDASPEALELAIQALRYYDRPTDELAAHWRSRAGQFSESQNRWATKAHAQEKQLQEQFAENEKLKSLLSKALEFTKHIQDHNDLIAFTSEAKTAIESKSYGAAPVVEESDE